VWLRSVFAVIVMFKSELAVAGASDSAGWESRTAGDQEGGRNSAALLIAREASDRRVIVVERDIGLLTFTESGVAMDAGLDRPAVLDL
jgi:hypothetical protein